MHIVESEAGDTAGELNACLTKAASLRLTGAFAKQSSSEHM